MTDPNHCPLLGLPTELRLLIYDSALFEGQAITVGSAELVGARPDIVHRLYGNNSSPLSGLPQNHEPVVSNTYNPRLLSITHPAIIPLTSNPPSSPPTTGGLPHDTHSSLLLTNKQIHTELSSHSTNPANRQTSLFVSYPHGLHVLSTSAPHLRRQARSVHLAGAYTPTTFNVARAARIGTHTSSEAKNYNGGSIPDHSSELGTMIAGLFGPNAHAREGGGLKKLELRIYYPGPDSYSTVWGDDNSPTVVALRNIFAGEVTIEVWRGRWGTGVYLVVVPNKEEGGGGAGGEGGGERQRGRRTVSTVWRRLEEGRKGEGDCGDWVVDPAWPEGEERGDVGVGEGCVVSSVHVPSGGS